MHKILVINLGGTSSKVAIFEDAKMVHGKNISHPPEALAQNKTDGQQVEYRKKMIMEWLDSIGVDVKSITAYAARGGNLSNTRLGGTYVIEGVAREEIDRKYNPENNFFHGTRIVVKLADALMGEDKKPILITDPPTINELAPEAQIAGNPEFVITTAFHALNSKAVARRIAEEMGKKYEDSRMIVAHLGAGTSVGAHRDGRVVDVNNCMRGSGPMSPNRVGYLQTGQLVDWCYSGKHTKDETLIMIRGGGGFKSYLGTDDLREVERMIEAGDEKAALIIDAYIYQVAREIGACAATLSFDVDAVIFTGGIANSKYVIGKISDRVKKIAQIKVYAGELESEGLALGALRVLTGEEAPVPYVIDPEARSESD